MSEPTPETLDQALTALADQPVVLIALDFDGVLAPLGLDPSASRPVPAAVTALARLASGDGVQLALVSGRPAGDLAALASPPAGTWLVGSHGAETGAVEADGHVSLFPLELEPEAADLLHRVGEALGLIAARYPGAWVEHKPAGAVLHTRELSGRNPDAAEAALAAALDGPGTWPGTHTQRGNQVVEIPVLSATKGQALNDLRRRLGAAHGQGPTPSGVAVLFAGDDVTDESALRTLGAGDVGIKVGTAPSVAHLRVADEEAMAAALHRLADLRRVPAAT